MSRSDDILPEEATVLRHDSHAAAQHILRLQAPKINGVIVHAPK